MCDAHTYIQQERLSGDATWRVSTIGFRRRDMAGLFVIQGYTWSFHIWRRDMAPLTNKSKRFQTATSRGSECRNKFRHQAASFQATRHGSHVLWFIPCEFFLQVTAKI